jgi:hypothetical protein
VAINLTRRKARAVCDAVGIERLGRCIRFNERQIFWPIGARIRCFRWPDVTDPRRFLPILSFVALDFKLLAAVNGPAHRYCSVGLAGLVMQHPLKAERGI